ncbi:c-type cytochrome biogenesis protein CcmI [Psychrobacter sp. FDAARGOS_221]|uniref:c-type cytochrome biogenesis protein CcmI n=1 Tax=Psychrobacter sp. FDAARGOS_221 TaxID=1975705 RepID=UPI000BB584AE|nr:c-type cytochrome biogenesis protein CcmI [Psychrobacter sp. FDAARGOS_221]PNK61574.1 c-type cytochrome biogenesis protein CcmI [Psychrobacter sp. FDAARGOS_221]
MPTLVIFVALAIILAILLAVIVLLPWLRVDKSAQNNQLIALNVEVFKERLAELTADYSNGSMTESEFNTQKTELERQLLLASEDKNRVVVDQGSLNSDSTNAALLKAKREMQVTRSGKARLTILVCVPLLIVLGYFLSADRSAVVQFWQAQDNVGQVADDLLTGKIDAPPEWAAEDSAGLMAAIQANVHHHAHDAKRWMRLADIYLAFEAVDQALEAQSRAYRLAPEDEEVAVGYAQTRFFASGGMLDSSGRRALQTALQKNPDHQGAQMLMAMGEARAGNFEQAHAWVARLKEGISKRDGDHSAALNSLDELSRSITEQQQAASQQAANDANPQVDSTQSITAQAVAVTLTIDSEIAKAVSDSDTLFVSIQQQQGGAPLAVKRLQAKDLVNAKQGLSVQLSDNDAMMPTHTLSKAMSAGQELVIKARVSKTGKAMPASGDLVAADSKLDYQDSEQQQVEVNMNIDQKLP